MTDPLPRPEYPRPHLRRERWVNLNGEWEFGAGPEPRFDRRILVPFAPQAELSGIGERWPGDVLWYRRRFEAVDAQCLLLHFGAVDHRATVWVNGVEVARHEGGHTPFSADLGGVVQTGVNELVVRAEDSLTDRTIPRGKQYWGERSESIFYTPTSGIWQTVWLEPVPATRIAGLRVHTDLLAGAVDLDIDAGGPVVAIASFDGVEVGRWSGRPGRGRLELSLVEPWSPDRPRLYDLEVRLQEGGDRVSTYFGLRTIEATKEGRLLLNGAPYFQRLVLDQGYFPGGLLTAATDGDLRRDIELARSLGFNGARKHQKVEDPRWLYWADVLGFLVWSEMANAHEYSLAGEERLTAEWREAVVRDRDHPSIVAWVPMNESFGLPDDDRKSGVLQRLRAATLAEDVSRPVVSNDGWEHAVTDLCTIHDYAGADGLRAHFASLDAALQPTGQSPPPYLSGFGYRGEPVVVSEFGGLALAGSGGWGWSEVRGGGEFLDQYRAMVEAVVAGAPVAGFCYTQLTDVEQERNGLLTFDRQPKLDPALIRRITETPKGV